MTAAEGEGAEALQTLLANPEPGARQRALAALAGLTVAAASALAEHGTVAADLVAMLANERRTEQRRTADILAPLLGGSPALVAALRTALAATNARLRWGAAYTLGRGLPPGPELWPAARETLALDDGDQRWAAAELACAVARRHPAVLAEIRAALCAESATLRKMCLYCLRDLGVADATGVARELLADGDAGVRLAALSTVARTPPGSPDAHATAARLLPLLDGDPEPGVRRATAATLGKLGVASEPVLERLRAAAGSSDPSLARAARSATTTLTGTA